MNKVALKILLPALLAGVLVAGCASPPPRLDLEGARILVARAYAVGADHLAVDSYQKAYEALREGETHLARGDQIRARESFVLSEHFAREAIRQAEREKARLEEELRAREAASRDQQTAVAVAPRPPELPMARPSVPPAAPPPRPAPPAVPALPEPVRAYDVREGDTLWIIAARPEVYGDPLLWPLLYKANRDQIRDPRQVYLGQVLDVPRNVSEAELEDVRAQARQSEIFPLP